MSCLFTSYKQSCSCSSFQTPFVNTNVNAICWAFCKTYQAVSLNNEPLLGRSLTSMNSCWECRRHKSSCMIYHSLAQFMRHIIFSNKPCKHWHRAGVTFAVLVIMHQTFPIPGWGMLKRTDKLNPCGGGSSSLLRNWGNIRRSNWLLKVLCVQ